MIYLIVGQPRSGKSQYAVKTAFDIQDKNIKIQKNSFSQLCLKRNPNRWKKYFPGYNLNKKTAQVARLLVIYFLIRLNARYES